VCVVCLSVCVSKCGVCGVCMVCLSVCVSESGVCGVSECVVCVTVCVTDCDQVQHQPPTPTMIGLVRSEQE
jgi:hypothetical protein